MKTRLPYSGSYAAVQSVYDDTEKDGDREESLASWRRLLVTGAAWVLPSVAATLIVAYLASQYISPAACFHAETEYGLVRDMVSSEQVRFFGTPHFDENGTAVLDYDAWPIHYLGESSKAERNWASLLLQRHFYISDAEAQKAWGDDYTQYYKHPDHGYLASLDVFHTLHCVNALRHTIDDAERLVQEQDPIVRANRKYHTDHCLELIRQSILCAGDLTLIPTRYWDVLGRPFSDSDQVHTCRNLDALQDFVKARSPERGLTP